MNPGPGPADRRARQGDQAMLSAAARLVQMPTRASGRGGEGRWSAFDIDALKLSLEVAFGPQGDGAFQAAPPCHRRARRAPACCPNPSGAPTGHEPASELLGFRRLS